MIVIFAACSDEAEGERCDTRNTRNGSDDCQPGLICVPGGDLGTGSNAFCLDAPNCGVCCPVDRTTATVSVCQLSASLPGADAAPPVTTDAGDAAADASDASDTDASDASDTDADAASTDASDADTDASDASSDGPG